MRPISEDRPIILFDGVCHLCNGVVQWVISHDPMGRYVFSPLQSDVAQRLLRQYQVDGTALETFVLIQDGEVYLRSEAALEVAKGLGGGWRLLGLFRFLPLAFRDGLYGFIARNRYLWFGKRSVCMVPRGDLRDRFLMEDWE